MATEKAEQMVGILEYANDALESIATAYVLLDDAQLQLTDMETPIREALRGCEDARTEETLEALQAAAEYSLRSLDVILPDLEDRTKTLKTAIDITRAEIAGGAENERRNWL